MVYLHYQEVFNLPVKLTRHCAVIQVASRSRPLQRDVGVVFADRSPQVLDVARRIHHGEVVHRLRRTQQLVVLIYLCEIRFDEFMD